MNGKLLHVDETVVQVSKEPASTTSPGRIPACAAVRDAEWHNSEFFEVPYYSRRRVGHHLQPRLG